MSLWKGHALEAIHAHPIFTAHRTPHSVAIVLTLRHAWLNMVWARVLVVSFGLLQEDGQEECKGDDDEYFSLSKGTTIFFRQREESLA